MKQAVIQIKGHQFLIKEGDELEIDYSPGKIGEKIKLEEVLYLSTKGKVNLGTPFLANASAEGEILEQLKGKKIRVARYRAKSRYRKVKGFRPLLTRIKIRKINLKKKSNG